MRFHKRVDPNITVVLKHISYFMCTLPFCLSIMSIFFMPKKIPIHFDQSGLADRYSVSAEFIIVGVLFGLTALLMTFAFDKINMSYNLKTFGFVVWISTSLIFMAVISVFINKIFEYVSPVRFDNGGEISSFVCALGALIMLIIGALKYSISPDSLKALAYCVCGTVVAVSAAVLNNYDILLVAGMSAVLLNIFTYIIGGSRRSKKRKSN